MKKLFAVLVVFLLVGCTSIKNEYEGITGKTAVKQIAQKEVLELFESGTAVVLFSFPESEWCQDLMPILNEEASALELEVYYFNVRDIRESNTEEYQMMYEEILQYVEASEFDALRYEKIYVPTIIKLENGTVVDFHVGTVDSHAETSAGLPELNSVQEEELRTILQRILS